MPLPVQGPDPTGTSRRPAGWLSLPSTALRRRAVGLVVGLALLIPAAAGPAADALVAGGSCTGWHSRTRPPETIRVGRTDGSVEVVDFQRYVEVVTAKEWPSYLPQAAIEAGATAVKQYGWAKTLAGNHRPSYYTASGKCYDVKDGVRDQIYKPERANVTPNIRQAVAATWGLTLYKDGRWFLTGYRTGSSRRCGADADGTRLYARSVTDCARRGLSRQQIQFKYYGRNLTLHWADGRIISWNGAQESSTTPKPQTNPTPRPAAPKPDPKPQPKPKPATSMSPSPSSVLIWLPSAADSATSGEGAASDVGSQISTNTVYSLPGTLLELPLENGAMDPWSMVCAAGVGTLPVGQASHLALLPPPFGCADASASGRATSDLSPYGAEPVLARVYVDVERAWIIY